MTWAVTASRVTNPSLPHHQNTVTTASRVPFRGRIAFRPALRHPLGCLLPAQLALDLRSPLRPLRRLSRSRTSLPSRFQVLAAIQMKKKTAMTMNCPLKATVQPLRKFHVSFSSFLREPSCQDCDVPTGSKDRGTYQPLLRDSSYAWLPSLIVPRLPHSLPEVWGRLAFQRV
jgi:hypothetical protein